MTKLSDLQEALRLACDRDGHPITQQQYDDLLADNAQLEAKLETYESIISGNNSMLEVAEHREAELLAELQAAYEELIFAATTSRGMLNPSVWCRANAAYAKKAKQ